MLSASLDAPMAMVPSFGVLMMMKPYMELVKIMGAFAGPRFNTTIDLISAVPCWKLITLFSCSS
jgi:hypothetical protein